MKTIYRIENKETMNGMWYDKNGNYKPIINDLCPNAVAKDFPMPKCPKHRKDNKKWYSGGKNIEDMHFWFSKEDAIELIKNGFKLYKYVVTEYQEKEMEILFTREGVIDTQIIEIEEVWS